jgi:uncharacterized metal-binding protein/predicted Fe-Mo cluster-binding NifX family protein
MIYGIPLFKNRVAPRCTIADSILFIKVTMNRIAYKKILNIDEKTWNDLLKIFNNSKVDIIVCGGINLENRKLLMESGISIIDNVACSDNEVIEGIKSGTLKNGFGFSAHSNTNLILSKSNSKEENTGLLQAADCLICKEHQCIDGKACNLAARLNSEPEEKEITEMLSSALDISLEDERILCRLSELVYFAIEMNYKRIGIAYCTDLSEPANVVAQALRRFFDVFPVCCKIGGRQLPDAVFNKLKIACNPKGQAEILNAIGVDFNIIIGLCIGTDSIFNQLSNAPVSALFVKDKSLANNPIGAVYSDYYLKEVTSTSVT